MPHPSRLLCALLLSGCAASAPDTLPPSPPAAVITSGEIRTVPGGGCVAFTAPETETRVVTQQVEVSPGVLREVVGPQQFALGPGAEFAVVCPPVLTEDFVASLQRALKIRRFYEGPISAAYDDATAAAVRAFQQADGVDSPILSVAAAQRLGLVPVPREP